ncbi:MAG: tetratricopeptide repeat protein [Anaerolineaceae bacterium]|nr:tetratricopeptide repeat protein [Anaerolineaceae bacterium]
MENIDQIINQAKAQFQNGEYKLAIDGFKAAHKYYLTQEDALAAAEMANNLSVAYSQDGQKEKALEIVQGTEETFEQAGDTLKQAMTLGNQGTALEALKKFPEAEEAYKRSAELFGDCGEKEYRSTVLKSLSALHIRQGKQLESIFSMQQSLESQSQLSLKDRFLKALLKIPFKLLGR